MNKLIRISQAAEILGVSVSTLRRWDDEGKLKSIRIGSNGNRRYKIKDIENITENGQNENN